ncbi:PREDICTED: 28S ribosomal protein S5, mitochondrial [Nicrophorus vespilloides]|uniref:Small ribosomal subunit protein uS5m n=1 Tax=Nicrophorus vespilloides TaxID=110193 RepID=A0ABM1MPR9_NICVS|nr:PREDICTED: 28S ribosomal protein S5, mitochondrial [Nicrophorus vespilloides]
MAVQLLNVTKTLQKLSLNVKNKLATPIVNVDAESTKTVLFGNASRNTNFFNKLPAEALWEGITSVSNAGKKRGRGKAVSKKNIKDLNRGQLIGVGKANIVWPGLSAPIIRGKELVQQQELPPDPDREQKLIQLRNSMGTTRFGKLSPIERGWTGTKMPGRSIGPPDAVGEDSFEGFDTKVLELKTVFNMKGNFGRKRRLSVYVVTGNGKGLAGFATGKGVESKTALRKAKNRAGQKLMHINIFRNHTVYHDFYTQFGKTKIFVSQRPPGHGLKCHRAIKTICEVIGIKDLYAKVEGSTNLQHVVKAFFLGLIQQKTHDKIAEEKKLHLVEICKENGFYPNVLASPTEVRKPEEIKNDESMDFKQFTLHGRVVLNKKKYPPFYTKLKSWESYLKKQERLRNHAKVKKHLIFEFGEIKSFLSEKYPECRPYKKPPKEVEETAED